MRGEGEENFSFDLLIYGGVFMIVKRPLTDEQLKKIAEREKPSQEDILNAQDQLFLYILQKLDALDNTQH